jgi:disulfide bond formation protein DsbB
MVYNRISSKTFPMITSSFLTPSRVRFGLFLMSMTGIGGFALGVFLEHYGNFPACRLCHVERLILLCGGITCFLSWIKWPTRMGNTLLFLTGIQWIIGGLISLYHTGIQYGLLAVPHFCSVQEGSSLDEFLSRPSASCDQRTLDFLGIPACLYLVIVFSVFAIACLWTAKERSRA